MDDTIGMSLQQREKLWLVLNRPRFSICHAVLAICFYFLGFTSAMQQSEGEVLLKWISGGQLSIVAGAAPSLVAGGECPPCSASEAVQEAIDFPAECSAPLPPSPAFATNVQLAPGQANVGKHTLDFDVNEWGIPMANSTIQINGKTITYDDIVYGYDLLFEDLMLFSRTSWYGVATQQDPSDAFALQDVLWRVQPDLVIEIGTNTGGGAIFYASIVREYNPDGMVLTIDPKDPNVDWAGQGMGSGACPHCRSVRCTNIWHSKNIKFIQGFSSESKVLTQVEQVAKQFKRVLVMHDGSHWYNDVLTDLMSYDRFITVGSYMIVQDTKMTRMYSKTFGNGYPLQSARDFVAGQGKGRYVIDKQFEYLLYSQHHDGYLRKIKA
mmetsp:Transcript_94553/g.216290  ORF Transcript_94553/g.216290 Transcript_94553/m.216290 type:complete len:381 (-) Transcript_94553:81-1223(-)